MKIHAERKLTAAPDVLYRAWTENLDQWFAAPGSVLMKPEIEVPFYFETDFEERRHPHYGRFLKLVPDELVKMTWVTGDPGTKGAETVVTIKFAAHESGTLIQLSHEGFADEETKDGHEEAWPLVLDHLEKCIPGDT
jgi:uncharacterized protein YndB with AHSA1/START domain